MKRYTIIGLIIVVNFLLILVAFLLHNIGTERIIRVTDSPIGLETVLFIPLLFIAAILFFLQDRFPKYGIGLIAIGISGVVFSVFYLNKSLAFEGNYETYKLRNVTWDDDRCFLNIEFNQWYNGTEVSVDKCLEVDSVQVRIDKGLFGMRTITNDVQIVENVHCDHHDLDSNNLRESHVKIAYDLIEKRCFTAAIYHCTSCITLDSLNPHCYYQRGLIRMATHDFENSLYDFQRAILLKLENNDQEKVVTLDNTELSSFFKEWLTNKGVTAFETKPNLNDIIVSLKDPYYINIDHCLINITYCLEKINKNKTGANISVNKSGRKSVN